MEILEWAKQHPWAAGLLTLGAVFILLWLLGFFGSSSSSSTSSSGNNLAAAYYAAEAAQTTAGTQLQMATEYYTNQTAQDQIQATAAQGIATTQANMYTTIGQQNASASTTINAQDNATAAAYYNDQLLASENSANDAVQTANLNDIYNTQVATAGYNASILNNYISTILPLYGGGQATYNIPGIGAGNEFAQAGVSTPQSLEAIGYTPSGAAQLLGVPTSGLT